MAMVWLPGRWAPSLVAILALVGVALPTAVAAGAPDHQGIACPTRPAPPPPAQPIMTPNDPHPARSIAPAVPGRPPRTAVATFALG